MREELFVVNPLAYAIASSYNNSLACLFHVKSKWLNFGSGTIFKPAFTGNFSYNFGISWKIDFQGYKNEEL